MRLLNSICACIVISLSLTAFALPGVTGIVTDTTGAPIPGASIGLYSSTADWEVTSDAAGKFSIANVPAGQYELEIAAQAFVVKIVPHYIVRADSEPLAVALTVSSCPPCCGDGAGCSFPHVRYEQSSGKASLRGTVSPSGGALPKTTIKIEKIGIDIPFRTVENGNDGKFLLPDMPPGRYVVLFSTPGYCTDSISNVRIRYRQTSILNYHLSHSIQSLGGVTLLYPGCK